MDRADILGLATELVTVGRADEHGDAHENFDRIAAMWSAYLGRPMTAADVAAMMVLFKVSRISARPGNADSWVDVAGYAALGGELSESGE